MAPSSGHIMVPKVVNAFRYAISRTAQAIRSRVAQSQGVGAASGQPIAIPIRNTRQPINRLAALRQSQGQVRTFSTGIRQAIAETFPSLRQAVPRAPLPVSRTSTLISRSPAASTFASTLRPNLTGGTLSRTAGGYGNVAGRRMFSHMPNTQGQIIQNVSAGVRAFWLAGQRAQFDGVDARTGEKRFVAVKKSADNATRKMMVAGFRDSVRGTSLEFYTMPELAAFGQKEQAKKGLSSVVKPLATDFARNLGLLAAIHRDLQRLSQLGDLPVSEPRPGVIVVRFPGCDAKTVENLCDELGVYKGLIKEDDGWAEERSQDVKMALLFPTAPSEGLDMLEEEQEDAAYFYETLKPPPQHILGSDHRSYTADETLSPLESIQGSHAHSFEQLSAPQSTLSWQPNPWIDVGSYERRSEQRSVREGCASDGDLEMESVMQFLAECDRRVRR